MTIKMYLILLGTFLPIIAVVVTGILASSLGGAKKWWAMLITPGIFFALTILFGKEIGHNGNLLFVALEGLFLMGLFVYYPVVITKFILWKRKSKLVPPVPPPPAS